MLRVTCFGAAETVTGSNFLLETPEGKKILVDCGLFQGRKQLEERNRSDWGFRPEEIDLVFLTHAHIDHCGRLPKLVKDGFQGPIITSPPTAELCEILLQDSAHIQEMDAEWQSRKRLRKGQLPVDPLYTQEDVAQTLPLLKPQDRDKKITIEPGLRARLRNAGHILGSSILELWFKNGHEGLKLVFSGDLGKREQLIVKEAEEIFDADYLFVESTYGNRVHRSFAESKQELLEAITYSHANGEKILIPSFAVERTQEILYVLGQFERQGLLPDIPIYLDSPLAIKATEIFKKNKKCYDKEAMEIVNEGFNPFELKHLRYTLEAKESMAINMQRGPAIIIAGNGMCTAGRIKHHLKHNLWRKGCSVVIVGYQAMGTTGRKLVEGAKQIKILGESVNVRAKIFTIGGFSAHADQNDLLEWIKHFKTNPKIFLIHGEKESSQALAVRIKKELGLHTHIPRWRERLILKAKELESETQDLPSIESDFSIQAVNTIVDLETALGRLKKRIQAKEKLGQLAEEDIEHLEFLKEELQALLSI